VAEAYAAHVGRVARHGGGRRRGPPARRATDTGAVAESRARRVYLTALFRARRHGSLDGVLAAGEAFGRLGDREVVQQALAMATEMARRSGDDLAQRRVQAFRSQWLARPLT
jgi:hypothetical protein